MCWIVVIRDNAPQCRFLRYEIVIYKSSINNRLIINEIMRELKNNLT